MIGSQYAQTEAADQVVAGQGQWNRRLVRNTFASCSSDCLHLVKRKMKLDIYVTTY